MTYHINISSQERLIKLLALRILPLNNSDLSAAVLVTDPTRAYISVSCSKANSSFGKTVKHRQINAPYISTPPESGLH